jgi:hypothetical protein
MIIADTYRNHGMRGNQSMTPLSALNGSLIELSPFHGLISKLLLLHYSGMATEVFCRLESAAQVFGEKFLRLGVEMKLVLGPL